ncbi:MAG: DUF1275 domain-containing protein [Clostridia bacterium]|nr:DUF1275 domain-containing protein [Clostridia bacterium]
MKKSFFIAFLLTFAGGFCDAYSYVLRDGVFSSMQTGNLVKLVLNLTEGSFGVIYFCPIIAFVVGIAVANRLNRLKHNALITYAACFFLSIIVFVLPCGATYNVIANCILSIICAIVFEQFRECNGITYTSIMCTNNLRLLTEDLTEKVFDKKKGNALFFGAVIISFVVGVVVGSFFSKIIGYYSILILSLVYLTLSITETLSLKK